MIAYNRKKGLKMFNPYDEDIRKKDQKENAPEAKVKSK